MVFKTFYLNFLHFLHKLHTDSLITTITAIIVRININFLIKTLKTLYRNDIKLVLDAVLRGSMSLCRYP